MATKITMDPIQFSMIWNIIIEKGKKHPQGGYILNGVRTMVTAGNNRKLYSTFSDISYIEIGNKIRVYRKKS